MMQYETVAEAETALGRGLTWAETKWLEYSAAMPDHWLYCHTTVIVFVVYTLAPLPLLLLETFAPALVLPYKLQPKVLLPPAVSLRCFAEAAFFFIFAVPMQIIFHPAVAKVYQMMGTRMGLPLPSIKEVAAQLLVYSLVEDYLSYWIHRLLHTKWGYEKIHRVHHEFTAPTGFAMSYSHWAENLALSIPALAGPSIVPCHITTHWIWFTFRLIEGINIHSGYHFPFGPGKLIPFYGGAEYHDYHHFVGGSSQSNFAPLFTYCDYLTITGTQAVLPQQELNSWLQDMLKPTARGGSPLDPSRTLCSTIQSPLAASNMIRIPSTALYKHTIPILSAFWKCQKLQCGDTPTQLPSTSPSQPRRASLLPTQIARMGEPPAQPSTPPPIDPSLASVAAAAP